MHPGRHEVVIPRPTAAEPARTTEPRTWSRHSARHSWRNSRGWRGAAEHFGRPQDMEWAVAGGPGLFVLQSRPMTALPPQPLRLNRFQKLMGPSSWKCSRSVPIRWTSPAGWSRGIAAPCSRAWRAASASVPASEQAVAGRGRGRGPAGSAGPAPHAPNPRSPRLSMARASSRFNPARWTEDGRFAAFLAERRAAASAGSRPLSWQEVIRLAEDAFAAMRWITELRVVLPARAFVPAAASCG